MDHTTADSLNAAIRTLALRHRARAGALLSEVGLFPGQEFLLMELGTRGPMIQAKIAEAIWCEPPSVTLMVRKLESAGYVARRASTIDRRATVVELTDAGRELIQRLHELWATLAGDATEGMSQDSIATATRLTAQLAENLGRKKGADSPHLWQLRAGSDAPST